MLGCRPLTDLEVIKVLESLDKTRDSSRNKAFFILGLKSGFRASELLSLKITDVYKNGVVFDRIRVQAKNMKGGKSSRNVILHPDAKGAILNLINENLNLLQYSDAHLFRGQMSFRRAVSYHAMLKILKKAFDSAGLTGTGLGIHSLRKTLAKNIWEKSGKNIVLTQNALGHKSVMSTQCYLSFDTAELDALMLA